MATLPMAPQRPHSGLTEVFPDVFFVTGTAKIGPMCFSRTMTVLRQGERLVLVNTIRLDEGGLAALEGLGRVTDTIRVGGFHGMDDRFYKERYGCAAHAIRGQHYFRGTDPTGEPYFEADSYLDAQSELPVEGASLYVFSCKPAEAVLRIPAGGGTLLSADALHNWAKPDDYFNFIARMGMPLLGFLGPCKLGPGWVKQIKPDKAEVRGLLDLDFENVLPGHGAPVLGGAKEAYRPAIEAYAGS